MQLSAIVPHAVKIITMNIAQKVKIAGVDSCEIRLLAKRNISMVLGSQNPSLAM